MCLGNYRCSLAGHDLNRQWSRPDVQLHPTIAAVRRLVGELARTHASVSLPPPVEADEQGVTLCLDVHAHTQRANAFIYGNESSTSKAFNAAQMLLPRVFDACAPDFDLASSESPPLGRHGGR